MYTVTIVYGERLNMYSLYEDPVVRQKHDAQKEIIKKAHGDIKEYSKIVKFEADELRKKYPGKFPKVSHVKNF